MKDRLGVLDGMRGIAVLLVLWYHIWEISWLPAPAPWLQWIPETGFIGVHLFFYLSGFVISIPFVLAQFAANRRRRGAISRGDAFIKIVAVVLLSIAVAYAIGYTALEHGGANTVARARHASALHPYLVAIDVRVDQRRAVDARGRSRVLRHLSVGVVVLFAQARG